MGSRGGAGGGGNEGGGMGCPAGGLERWKPPSQRVTKQLIWRRGCAEAPFWAHRSWLSLLPERGLTEQDWLWPHASLRAGGGLRVPAAAISRGQPVQLCLRGGAAHGSHALHCALWSPLGPELGEAGGGGRKKWEGLRSQPLGERREVIRADPRREPRLSGCCGGRFGRGGKPEAAGKSEMPPDPGQRRERAGSRRQAGIWGPVRSVRHRRSLPPALAPSHAPGTWG